MNGVDVLIAFAYQQNQRFNALIAQCQGLQFNFINCRKDDFFFCLDRLSDYTNNIEKLVLSEQNTPGQIQGFFSRFPLLVSFRRLRQFYLYFDAKAIESHVLQQGILSLSNTTIDSLSIKAINSEMISAMDFGLIHMFQLSTLKRFSISSGFESIQWDSLANISSNIEYLTITGVYCQFQQLQSIFRCTSNLKYLNVRLTCTSRPNNLGLINHIQVDVLPMPTLDTLILSFQETDPTTFDMLAESLNTMSGLRRLEIKAHSLLLDASAWEILLQTSLPCLTYFVLQTTPNCIQDARILNKYPSFETSFWIEKKNFYMLTTKHQRLDFNRFDVNNMRADDHYEYDLPVIHCWTVPLRARLDSIPVNKITSLGISGVANSLSCYNYYNNVKHLVIRDLNEDLFEWIKIHVNYSRISYLDIAPLIHESNTITLLLSYATNINSLRIQYDRLLAHQNVYLEKKNCLKCLDISVVQHKFDKNDIVTIARLFPDIEHLRINTTSLFNVPLLQTYLPNLRCLTFKIMCRQFLSNDEYEQRLWDNNMRTNAHFLFQRRRDFITVWIDQDALKDSYWKKFALDSSSSVSKSIATVWKRISSFFE
ncbi:unnamed protein product [Rotaria sp. Silwood1]|nr:unnamed protein product [Rotaria sp. Silwood1]CAF4060292.1 unnamed protein product [Rotaria sp. Silwood1]CAF5040958.1 unnamed protein product [Rotaria sp. Silwood1]CAF5124077.1 unnamed protein product [Rotaria sp. Silwood1]